MKIVWKLFRLLNDFRKWVALSIVLGWATVASWVALISTSAYLISYAALQPSIAELQVAIVGVRFFGISRGVFRYLERLVSHSVTFKLLAGLRVWFYGRLEPLAPAKLEDQRSGDLLSGIVSNVETLQDFYIRVVAPPVVALLSSIGVVWFFGRWSIEIAITIAAFQILTGVVVPVVTRKLSEKPGRTVIQTRASVSGLVAEIVQGHAEILAFQQEEAWIRRVSEQVLLQQEAESSLNRMDGLQAALISVGVNLTAVLLLWATVPLVETGVLDGRLLAVIVLGAMASFDAILPLPQAFLNLEQSIQVGRRLFRIGEQQPEIDEEAGRKQLGSFSTLKINNLSFAYSRNRDQVLTNLNVSLQPGKKIAIVGASGSGKSTIFNLLLRFWDYTHGEILYNGHDLRGVNPFEWRKLFSYVPQRVLLFNTSMRENILIGKPGALQDEVNWAASVANIHNFIMTLPEGYETIAGEQGALLSGGERQRLGIARAVLKNAPIMLLDEPTANLDRINEQIVVESILKAAKNLSLIWISHRLTAMDRMDEILVLDGGRVVEAGTHTGLLAAGGHYARMIALEREHL